MRVLFILDRVAHYHVDMFRAVDQQLRERGIDFVLASGTVNAGAVGRTGIDKQVLPTERKYRYFERSYRGWVVRFIHGLPALVRDVRPQAVVCSCHVGNLSHWWLALNRRRFGYRLVAWQCGYEYHPGTMKQTLLSQFVPRFDFHLAYHTNARDYALAYGARSDQVVVMHNTINEAKIKPLAPEAARAVLLARHPQIGDRRILLFVGAVLDEKRIELVMEAMDLLKRTDTVLLVVGDGPHLPALKAYAAGRGDVVFAGSVVEGVGPYFDAATIYLMPGTGGLGLNEAMAHGVPMVAGYADGSADDLVLDGETGYRLRRGTADELAGHIARLLDDPAACRRMGQRGLELINGPLAFSRFVRTVADALADQAAKQAA